MLLLQKLLSFRVCFFEKKKVLDILSCNNVRDRQPLTSYHASYSEGYNQYDFWTSGNRLGTDMFLWMSTGLPFNATFDLMNVSQDGESTPTSPQEAVVMTSEQPAPLLRRPGSARQRYAG